jgi:hypothetical protein
MRTRDRFTAGLDWKFDMTRAVAAFAFEKMNWLHRRGLCANNCFKQSETIH